MSDTWKNKNPSVRNKNHYFLIFSLPLSFTTNHRVTSNTSPPLWPMKPPSLCWCQVFAVALPPLKVTAVASTKPWAIRASHQIYEFSWFPSQNQHYRSLNQPPICKTQESGPHAPLHAPPRAARIFWPPIDSSSPLAAASVRCSPTMATANLHHWVAWIYLFCAYDFSSSANS